MSESTQVYRIPPSPYPPESPGQCYLLGMHAMNTHILIPPSSADSFFLKLPVAGRSQVETLSLNQCYMVGYVPKNFP